MIVERLFADTMVLGECPVWDETTKTLYWIDITAGQVWSQIRKKATIISSYIKMLLLQQKMKDCLLLENKLYTKR